MNKPPVSTEDASPKPATGAGSLPIGLLAMQWLVLGGLGFYISGSWGGAAVLASGACLFSAFALWRAEASANAESVQHNTAGDSEAQAVLHRLWQTTANDAQGPKTPSPENDAQLIEQAQTSIQHYQLLLAAFNAVQIPLVMLSAEGKIHSANLAGRQLLKAFASTGAVPDLPKAQERLAGRDLSPLLQQAGLDLTRLGGQARQERELTLGEQHLMVSASCLAATGGASHFITVWQDASEHRRMRQQVRAIVSAARQGDLSQRIERLQSDSFLTQLAEDINALLHICDQLIGDTRTLLQAIAQGNLTTDIQGQYQGRFAELQHDANDTMGKLTQVMNDIQLGVCSLSSVATELAQTNNGLAQRTEEQAAGIEQTAATLEEMTASVKQSADHAQMANSNATQVRERITQTQAVVGETIEAMGSINQASNKILSIIGLINDLSFQTNLLALNAAVEAARAGEQGRGFAVVATEVRNLAERSASAAKEIKHLIEDSARQVQQGTESVNRSSEAMAEVVTSVSGVTGLIEEIALASQEQANGIGQINQALARLEATTQQNASMVQQTRSASESTGQQAHRLKEMMAFFTVK